MTPRPRAARTRTTGRVLLSRRGLGAATALVLGGALVACTDGDGDGGGGNGDSAGPSIGLVDGGPATSVLPGDDPAETAVQATSVLFESADVVLLASPETVESFAALAGTAHIPLLLGTDQPVLDELSRLGVEILVVAPGTDVTALGENYEVLEVDPDADGAADDLPDVSTAEDAGGPITLLLDPDGEDDPTAQTVARANVEAAGGAVAELPGGEPRRDATTVEVAEEAAPESAETGVLALGASFGDTEQLTARLQQATTVPQLPGGGQVLFPGRRFIAAYGSPNVPALGILGEQDLEATIERTRELAARYDDYSEVQVIPAFEIIATVASAHPTPEGNYSNELDPEMLREWVDAAGEAGVYVVLDLQPGRTDFLTQAKLYEGLLREPHVGLALDPEWRLGPDQRHMVQIGSVSAAEINETSTWLADLTAENDLPQKMLILHQFSLNMIRDRQDVDTSRPEVAIVLHADGHGVPENKMSTWRALQEDLPEGIYMAWKNFIDEDTPTFTPEQTYDVEPRPWFVSYQ